MRQLLILNPNTSASVSALLQAHAQQVAGPGVNARTVTARFGAPYIACEASYAVASHAVLDAWAAALTQDSSQDPSQAHPAPDAVLIGCFGDPGLLALREVSTAPVTGLAEAAFIEAARAGPFAIVTGGERWKPMLQRLAHALGHGANLVGIHTLMPTGAELAADPSAAVALLRSACQDAVRTVGARAIIIGGAGLAGMASAVQPMLDVPVIDSVSAGVRHALSGLAKGDAGATGRFDFAWMGVSQELGARGWLE
jgi:allantoin racemase